MKSTSRLHLEHLEDRLTPTVVAHPWLDANQLTLSFAPDGTHGRGWNSNLFDMLKESGSPKEAGQLEILRAFQAWAVNSNINIGLVDDHKDDFGSEGSIQGNERFGAIRVGSGPMTPEVVATGSPFDWAIGTWSGSLLFNGNHNFGINPRGEKAEQYDLFSVTLHEAGHILGLGHEYSDPTSVMFENYTGSRLGLSVQDILDLQSAYGGTRRADDFEGAFGNNSLTTATAVGAGNQQVLAGDLTTLDDVDYYKFQLPANEAEFRLKLATSGISLLLPNLTVYDSSFKVVTTTAKADLFAKDLTIRVDHTDKGDGIYYVRVDNVSNDVFGIGTYQLRVDSNVFKPAAARRGGINHDGKSNASLVTATPLVQQPASMHAYSYFATMKDTRDSHFYQIVTPGTVSDPTQAMRVMVRTLSTKNTNPGLHIYDQAGQQVGFQVLNNDESTYAIQMPAVVAGQTYYIETTEDSPFGPDKAGDYLMTVDFATVPSQLPTALAANTLDQSNPQSSGLLEITQSTLLHFALSAMSDNASVSAEVTLTISDSSGKLIYTMTASTAQPSVTVNLFLAAGTYKLSFWADLSSGENGGDSLRDVTYSLAAGVFSDPIGPYYAGASTGSTNTSGTTGTSYTYVGSSTGTGTQPYYY